MASPLQQKENSMCPGDVVSGSHLFSIASGIIKITHFFTTEIGGKCVIFCLKSVRNP